MATIDRVRWGLIGCGDIARKRVAPALRDLPNCELVAINRADAPRAESFATEFGANRWYPDWRELLADAEIDAVYIATPVHLHAEQTIAAAAAGKNVLCEKPMALSVEECDRMIDACVANRVRLGVAYYRRFYPVLERIKQLLREGAIGQPVMAQINAFEWFDPDPANPRRWLLNKERSGGGPMFDFGCHRVGLLADLLGPVREVKALANSAFFNRSVEDTATALFGFDSGAQATLSVTHATREPQDTLHIFGTQGSLHVEALNSGSLKIVGADGGRAEHHAPHANVHQPLIDDFARAIIEQRDPQVTGAAGREVNRVLEAIYRDAERSAAKSERGH
jgi:predicted dehydrogenase